MFKTASLELTFAVPRDGKSKPDTLYGHKSRDFLAADAGDRLDPMLFWRSPDNQPIQGIPLIRWGGGPGMVRLQALGDAQIQCLYSAIPDLHQAVVELMPAKPELNVRRGQVSAAPASTFRYYTAFNVGLPRRKGPERQRWDDGTPEERASIVERLIRSAITRQIEALGGRPFQQYALKVDQESLADQENYVMRGNVAANQTIHGMYARRVSFSSNLHLSQNGWAFGRLLNKGSGRIAQATMDEQTAQRLVERSRPKNAKVIFPSGNARQSL